MLFNSLDFIVFLIVILIISNLLNKYTNLEKWFLVFASGFFYGQWSWRYLLLIYTTIIIDFFIGKYLYTSYKPKKILLISFVVNLSILFFFKYFGFFVGITNDISRFFNTPVVLSIPEIILPIGISFYTFQSLSYTMDIYRNEIKPRQRFVDYALFISFFPQLVAGPIVRASEFFQQLDKRKVNLQSYKFGYYYIILGLVKKIVIADNLSLIVDPVFNSPHLYGWKSSLIAVYAFAFQIYFDFSGYTDIARGVARLLGFKFPLNFNYPYLATSFQEFWRRWHITLSRWLRDYLYISMGGNKTGKYLTYQNIFITMLVGGLWHGASWNFLIWGCLHGVFIILEKTLKLNFLNGTHVSIKIIKWLLVFNLICFAWIFFRSSNWNDAMTIIINIFSMQNDAVQVKSIYTNVVILLNLLVFHFILNKSQYHRYIILKSSFMYVMTIFIMLLAIIVFSNNEPSQFIYFQF